MDVQWLALRDIAHIAHIARNPGRVSLLTGAFDRQNRSIRVSNQVSHPASLCGISTGLRRRYVNMFEGPVTGNIPEVQAKRKVNRLKGVIKRGATPKACKNTQKQSSAGWANQSNQRGLAWATRAKPCKTSYSYRPYINVGPRRIAFCRAKPHIGSTLPQLHAICAICAIWTPTRRTLTVPRVLAICAICAIGSHKASR